MNFANQRFGSIGSRLEVFNLSMTLPSNGLRIDRIVLAVRTDEPDVDDPVG